jgi:ferredoxin/coenzyme F420-reducing hydrogenase delta subunit
MIETSSLPRSSAPGPPIPLEPAAVPEANNATADLPAIRAEGLLRRADNIFLRLVGGVHRAIAPALNPLAQLGAAANTCLMIAIVTGIALLIWYTPSVHQAHASLEAIKQSSWLGQLVRSLHRYSSDACLFLVLLHAARIFVQRRFVGPRWWSWTTGLILHALLWFVVWTGYWLVWDVRAQHLAVGTAKLVDRLPFFVEPLSRTFLTNDSVHSLLFFITFFTHMLLPLMMGIALWMHLMRVNRAKLFTGPALTFWITASLVMMSMLLPATSAVAAQMTVKAERFTMDWWFLWPVVLTDRLSGGLLWAVLFAGSMTGLTVPWWMVRRRLSDDHKAQVDVSRCMGCTLCAKDCPFDAITMVPREDGKPFDVHSFVNPSRCVGCGVCTGACDSQAINLPWLNSRNVTRQLEAWIDSAIMAGEKPHIAFVCGESAGVALQPDLHGRSARLPGYRICTVPCVGWVSAVMIERALQRGAAGALLVGCGEGDPSCREGAKWQQQRLAGARQPALDPGKAEISSVRFAHFDRTRPGELIRAAQQFRDQSTPGAIPGARRNFARVAAVALLVLAGAILYAFSNLPYRTPLNSQPEFVVAFNHLGALVEQNKLTAEELSKRLPHMRAQVNVTRERVPVRLRIAVDGAIVHERVYAPHGFQKDGPSSATVRLPLAPGSHTIQVFVADTADRNLWRHQWEQTIQSEPNRIHVLLFDTKSGFSLH